MGVKRGFLSEGQRKLSTSPYLEWRSPKKYPLRKFSQLNENEAIAFRLLKINLINAKSTRKTIKIVSNQSLFLKHKSLKHRPSLNPTH